MYKIFFLSGYWKPKNGKKTKRKRGALNSKTTGGRIFLLFCFSFLLQKVLIITKMSMHCVENFGEGNCRRRKKKTALKVLWSFVCNFLLDSHVQEELLKIIENCWKSHVCLCYVPLGLCWNIIDAWRKSTPYTNVFVTRSSSSRN